MFFAAIVFLSSSVILSNASVDLSASGNEITCTYLNSSSDSNHFYWIFKVNNRPCNVLNPHFDCRTILIDEQVVHITANNSCRRDSDSNQVSCLIDYTRVTKVCCRLEYQEKCTSMLPPPPTMATSKPTPYSTSTTDKTIIDSSFGQVGGPVFAFLILTFVTVTVVLIICLLKYGYRGRVCCWQYKVNVLPRSTEIPSPDDNKNEQGTQETQLKNSHRDQPSNALFRENLEVTEAINIAPHISPFYENKSEATCTLEPYNSTDLKPEDLVCEVRFTEALQQSKPHDVDSSRPVFVLPSKKNEVVINMQPSIVIYT